MGGGARARREASVATEARAEAYAERCGRGRLAMRARAARDEREIESLVVASPSHGPLAPLHTRYYHVPDTIPMHPFSAEHLRGFLRVDGVLS